MANKELKEKLFKNVYRQLISVKYAELKEEDVLEISLLAAKQFAERYNIELKLNK